MEFSCKLQRKNMVRSFTEFTHSAATAKVVHSVRRAAKVSWFDFEFSPEAETKCCDVICRDQRNNLVTDVTVQQDAAFLSTCEQFNLPVYTHTHTVTDQMLL